MTRWSEAGRAVGDQATDARARYFCTGCGKPKSPTYQSMTGEQPALQQ